MNESKIHLQKLRTALKLWTIPYCIIKSSITVPRKNAIKQCIIGFVPSIPSCVHVVQYANVRYQTFRVYRGESAKELQVSWDTPGARWVILTCTACFLAVLKGSGHSLYVTSSPSFGTYSPSISDMWTNICSCVSLLTMKPWPLFLQNDFTFPV